MAALQYVLGGAYSTASGSVAVRRFRVQIGSVVLRLLANGHEQGSLTQISFSLG